MRCLIAPASFKGSIGAIGAAEAIAAGVRDARADAEIDPCPIADGGEGTAEILARACERYEERWSPTTDALGRPIDARWFLVREPGAHGTLLTYGTAIVDAAACLGITVIEKASLDPDRATSSGLGTMLRAIADEGAVRIIIGLGGTATMDCGIGLADALGWQFADASGAAVEPSPTNLARIASAIAPEQRIDAEIIALADVRAPLTGPTGAPRIFGPQKGASPAQVERLDAGFASFARAVNRVDPTEPGAGAAGGLGWALRAFTGAALLPGARSVLDAVGFAARARAADLIITGEGRLDAQTAMGKSIAAVCDAGRAAGTPVVAIVGRALGDADAIAMTLGLDAIIPLSAGDADDARAMAEVRARLRAAGARVAAARTEI